MVLSGPCQAGDRAVTRIRTRRDNVPAAKGRLNSRYIGGAEMICNCVFQRTISPEHFLSAATYLQRAQRSKNAIEAAAGQYNEQRNKRVLRYGMEVETKPNRLVRSCLIIRCRGELEACDVSPQELYDTQNILLRQFS